MPDSLHGQSEQSDKRLRLTLNGEQHVLGPVGTALCVALGLPAIALVLLAVLLIVVACVAVIPAFAVAWTVTRGR
jgi:hypothetical protein